MILLVDSDPVNTQLWTHVLARRGCRATTVLTGAEALDVVSTQPVDMIVCALRLPDCDGISLIGRLGEKPYLRDVPVVVCTGSADQQTVQQAIALGVADFLLKPIRADHFASRLERVLRLMPSRWEERADTTRRLQISAARLTDLIKIVHERIAATVALLDAMRPDAVAAVAPAPAGSVASEVDVHAAVQQVRDAAMSIGAFRCARLITHLWREDARVTELQLLHEALRIEARAFELVVAGAYRGGPPRRLCRPAMAW